MPGSKGRSTRREVRASERRATTGSSDDSDEVGICSDAEYIEHMQRFMPKGYTIGDVVHVPMRIVGSGPHGSLEVEGVVPMSGSYAGIYIEAPQKLPTPPLTATIADLRAELDRVEGQLRAIVTTWDEWKALGDIGVHTAIYADHEDAVEAGRAALEPKP